MISKPKVIVIFTDKKSRFGEIESTDPNLGLIWKVNPLCSSLPKNEGSNSWETDSSVFLL